MTDDRYSIIHAECTEAMQQMAPESIDAIVTDPPYGLGKQPNMAEVLRAWMAGEVYAPKGKGFMGKTWDAFVPGPEVWRECFRVLKPGGHLLTFGGTRTFDLITLGVRFAGFDVRDVLSWLYGTGWPKSPSVLKPAWEPIVMARKPLVGTVAENVLKHGTGAINVDACRIPGKWTTWQAQRGEPILASVPGSIYGGGSGLPANVSSEHPGGRWPANVVLDEAAAEALDAQTGTLKTNAGSVTKKHASVGYMGGGSGSERKIAASSGGGSRFLYVAKAGKRERPRVNGVGHVTVKPVALMRWLVRMVTPPGGTVLDPFTGSGSTGVAALHEGFRFIGCEREAEYVEIARLRLAHTMARTSEQLHLGPKDAS